MVVDVEVGTETVVDTSNAATGDAGGEETHLEPHVEVKEDVKADEAKTTKDALDEIVAKVKGSAKSTPPTKESGTTPKVDSQKNDAGEVSASDKYTPNFKFTANKKEQEIPEFLRSGIKDKATEKQVRELCEKAYGLDTVKADRDETHQKFSEVSTAHNNLLAGVQAIRSDFQRGDIDSFLQKLKIPEEVMLKWAVGKAQYYNSAPEEQAAMDARTESMRKAAMLETHNSTLEASNAQAATRMKQLELDFTFLKPEIQALEKSVDAQFGKTGVLRQMVIDEGYRTWVETKGKTDLTPAQALAQVQARYGIKPGEPVKVAEPTTAAKTGEGGTPAIIPNKPKTNVIPNLKGSTNTSPISTKPKSIADLKKLSAQMT